MSRTRIKICGITRPADAVIAAEAGADAVGMVFYPQARRCISLQTARDIMRLLPAFVTPVGLFVDQDIEDIRRTAGELGIKTVQLHGHEEPTTVAALREYTVLKSIKAVRETLAVELQFWRESIAAMDLRHLKAFVLETPTTGVPGGSGEENDWETIEHVQRTSSPGSLPPLIAAGGLRPDNVLAVIRRIRPYAVDVSSGVESGPGEKSEAKIRAFTEAIAGA